MVGPTVKPVGYSVDLRIKNVNAYGLALGKVDSKTRRRVEAAQDTDEIKIIFFGSLPKKHIIGCMLKH